VITNKQNLRSGLRNAGLRAITIWVPDTRREGFADECRRQSLSLCKDAHEAKMLDQLRTVADTKGWQ
jgi:hypothetical protein